MRYHAIAAAAGLLLTSTAYAQSSFQNLNYNTNPGESEQIRVTNPPVAVNPTTDGVFVWSNALAVAGNTRATATAEILPLSTFASQQDIAALNQADQTLSSQILQNTQAIASLNQSVRRAQSHASQGVAAVSSLTVVPPNPGDRFSVSFGGGEYGSQGGGGMSFAYRPPEAENVMVFAGYARTVDSNLFKGGVSFSFH